MESNAALPHEVTCSDLFRILERGRQRLSQSKGWAGMGSVRELCPSPENIQFLN